MENPQIRVSWRKPPQKDIMRPAEMLVVIVAGHALSKVFVQSDGVDVILKIIAGVLDFALHRLAVVSLDVDAEQIRFPVDDVVSPLEPKYEIDEPFKKPLEPGNRDGCGCRR